MSPVPRLRPMVHGWNSLKQQQQSGFERVPRYKPSRWQRSTLQASQTIDSLRAKEVTGRWGTHGKQSML